MARGAIRGIVKDEYGIPLADITIVIVSGPDHQDMAALTGTDGRFDFGNLPTGRYLLRAYGNDSESKDIAVMVFPMKIAFIEVRIETAFIDDDNEM